MAGRDDDATDDDDVDGGNQVEGCNTLRTNAPRLCFSLMASYIKFQFRADAAFDIDVR
jgi:hypothetical protein